MKKKYIPSQFEKKWQDTWRKDRVNAFKNDPKKKKWYTLVELPYPSGDLHIGHWFTFVTPDVLSRFKKMTGHDVFFPHGYDAFGLPAENAAIKRNIHPKDWTMSNIETMTAQFRTMGSMMDLDDVTISCLPEYYRWNQWIFQQMFEKGLAYRGKVLSNWCEHDKTVLANEHVENGKCWRCGNEVVQKEVEQWFLKITEYADRLIWPEKPSVDWPTSVKVGQNAWIGKKEGIEITYKIEGSKETVTVFTTRPDTNFGATFIALAPEHKIVSKITTAEQKKEVDAYVTSTSKKTELERLQEGKEKTGAFTGAYAINTLTGSKIPIYVSDFVLINFGTGALVGVPGHDMRDFEFATKFNIPVIRVVAGADGDKSEITKPTQVQEKEGRMINSAFLDGMDIHRATTTVMEHMEKEGYGKRVVNYHIRDWSVSRQRYWGTPVPMIHCADCGIVPVPEKDLPVELPYEVDYMPKGKPPLASNEEWMKVTCPKCGKDARRDAETLDTFFDSSWYYYRYVNNKYDLGPFDKEKVPHLMPLDIYFGGAEHTLGHTLYARFFTKFFKDIGLIGFDEFALKRIQHGIVLGPDGSKMSKSIGNVINPDDVVKEYGADTVRLYLCFMMPYEATAPWSTDAIAGMHRFLQRIWQLREKISDDKKQTADDTFQLNSTIQKVEKDMEHIKGNTAIAFIMTWLNYLSKQDKVTREEYKTLLLLLAPFAPHMSEELWEMIGEKSSIHAQAWPSVKKGATTATNVKIPVQVNGRIRTVLVIPSDKTEQSYVEAEALQDEAVIKHLEGKKYKVIYISGKILNVVTL